ncbi:MAG: ribonuclease E/G, partial [Flavobacteriaceae bacterium CG_4_8_14_3_um_filter_31_8]
MKTELIIRSNSADIDFALLRDGKLIELNNETTGNKFSVGDIFLAKIGKVLTG